MILAISASENWSIAVIISVTTICVTAYLMFELYLAHRYEEDEDDE